MRSFQPPTGTIDWLPRRAAARRVLVDRARAVFERAGYREIVTPVFEETALFARTSGEASEVVGKEMYSFTDRGGRELTLRPELTAPIVRAYLGHGLAREAQPVKLWTVASCYRYNRAQRGRYREFTAFDAEALGSDDPAVDAELIALHAAWYAELGIEGLQLELNTIGDPADRPPYLLELRGYLDAHLDELHPDVRRQRDLNPLRAFDTKDPRTLEIMAGAPRISDHVDSQAAAHFTAVRAFLDARGIAYRHEPALVRGLDYYTRTTWEFKWPPLGAQSTIGGGGRYDGLAETLGGARTPGVGFGAGIERLLLALEEQGLAPAAAAPVDAFFAVFEPLARPRLHALMDETRRAGLHCDADFAGRGVKGQLKHADRLGAAVTVLCGPDEWAAGTAAVRRMTTGEQVDVPLSELLDHLLHSGSS